MSGTGNAIKVAHHNRNCIFREHKVNKLLVLTALRCAAFVNLLITNSASLFLRVDKLVDALIAQGVTAII